LRLGFQLAFAALNIWIGVEFFAFVRQHETAGQSAWASRPPGVEGWLPIASLMNLKLLAITGHVPAIHPAGIFLLLAFLAISFAFRKAFCSWLCPVGTLSELLWKLGRRVLRKSLRLPQWVDIGLRSLKYALLGLFLYVVLAMPVAGIRAFLEGPYGLIDDVKMLNFFRYLGVTGIAVLAALALLSIFIQNFWCRYLCPYGALMGLVARLSPVRIRRDPELCVDCAKCARECPSLLKVDKLIAIGSAECTGCLECVAACPAAGALEISIGKRREIPAWAMAAGIAILFLGVVGFARLTGHWATGLPERVYFDLIPRAQEFAHP
jgi:polyferredoxin